MKILNQKNILALAGAALLSSAAFAQTLDESLTVEGRYKPEIIAADRLYLFPTLVQFTAPVSTMEYEQKGVAADFAPDALPMAATGWRAIKDFSTTKGYLDLRLGSWLNSSLSAGYQALRTEDTRLNVRLQHNSTSLWRPSEKNYSYLYQFGGEPAKRFRYDETIGADLRQRVGDLGVINADLQYHLGYFNYFATYAASDNPPKTYFPTQTLNDVYAKTGWSGTSDGNLSYDLSADFRHFAYRGDYTLDYDGVWDTSASSRSGDLAIYRTKGSRENELNIGGGLSYRLGNQAAIRGGIKYTGVFYKDDRSVNRIQFTPGYDWSNGNTSLRIGVNAAYTAVSTEYLDGYVAAPAEKKFRIAPDVRFSIRRGIIGVSASVTGGTDIRTLSWRHQMCYYDSPEQTQFSPAYTPVDALVGMQLNPGGKFTVGLEAGWKKTLHEAVGGIYMLENLNNVGPLSYQQDSWWLKGLEFYASHESSGQNLHGFHAALNLGYDLSKYFAVTGRATFQPQKGETGVMNGFDRPKYTVDVTALSHPIEPLTLSLGYNLRACRYLLPGNLSLLNLGADYRINDRLSVGVELNNLLNRHDKTFPDIPTEGFNAAAGFQMVF